ncbi:unnamed protein product [Gordionus sp. m RMFG-2023]
MQKIYIPDSIPIGLIWYMYTGMLTYDIISCLQEGMDSGIRAGKYVYHRIPEQMWENSLKGLKCCGLNAIEIEIPWNRYHLNYRIVKSANDDIEFANSTTPIFNVNYLEDEWEEEIIYEDLFSLTSLAVDNGVKIIVNLGPTTCKSTAEPLAGLPIDLVLDRENTKWWNKPLAINPVLKKHMHTILQTFVQALEKKELKIEEWLFILIDCDCIGPFKNVEIYITYIDDLIGELNKRVSRNNPKMIYPKFIYYWNNSHSTSREFHNSNLIYETFAKYKPYLDAKMLFRKSLGASSKNEIRRIIERKLIGEMYKGRNPKKIVARNVPSDWRLDYIVNQGKNIRDGMSFWNDESALSREFVYLEDHDIIEINDFNYLIMESFIEHIVSTSGYFSIATYHEGTNLNRIAGGVILPQENVYRQLTNQYGSVHRPLVDLMGRWSNECKTIRDIVSKKNGKDYTSNCYNPYKTYSPIKLIVVDKVMPLRRLLRLYKQGKILSSSRMIGLEKLELIDGIDLSLTPYIFYCTHIQTESYNSNLTNKVKSLYNIIFKGKIVDTVSILINERIIGKFNGNEYAMAEQIIDLHFSIDDDHARSVNEHQNKNKNHFELCLMLENKGFPVDIKSSSDVTQAKKMLKKGILGTIILDGKLLNNSWDVFKVKLDKNIFQNLVYGGEKWKIDKSWIRYTLSAAKGPAIFLAKFMMDKNFNKILGIYLHMIDWYSGFLMINGHVLGKYDHVGPQQTVFCPIAYLINHEWNFIIIFEEKLGAEIIDVIDFPILDESYNIKWLINSLTR